MSHDRKGVVIIYPKGFERKNEDLSKIQTSTETLNIDNSDALIVKEESNFEEASNESEMSNVTYTGMSKPKLSYAKLISEALLNSSNGMLILSDIYKSISARHPYYQMNVTGWQNSIRHTLSLDKSFVKCADGLSTDKRGNYWKLSKNLSKSVMKTLPKEKLSKIQKSTETLNIDKTVILPDMSEVCYFGKASNEAFVSSVADTDISKPKMSYPKLISDIVGHPCIKIKEEKIEVNDLISDEKYFKDEFDSENTPEMRKRKGDQGESYKKFKDDVKKRKGNPKDEVDLKVETNEFPDENQISPIDSSNFELSEQFIVFILKQVDKLCENIKNGDPDSNRSSEINENLENAMNSYRNILNFGREIFVGSEYYDEIEPENEYDVKDVFHDSKVLKENVGKTKVPKKKVKKTKAKQVKIKNGGKNNEKFPPEKNKGGRPTKNDDKLELVRNQCGRHNLSSMALMFNMAKGSLCSKLKSEGIEYKKKVTELTAECKLCEMKKNTVVIKRDLLMPMLRFNSEKDQFECSICNFSAPERGIIFAHLRSIHGNEIDTLNIPDTKSENNQECDGSICQKVYGRLGKQFWCQKCSKKLQLAKEMKKKESKVCPECGVTVQNLSGHLTRNHNRETQICEICSREYPSHIHLTAHRKKVHEKIPCTQCGKLFAAKVMNRHIQSAHTPDDQKKFRCDTCGKGFIDKQRLSEHNNIHTGAKPYVCKYCPLGFASRGTHAMHEKSHIGRGRNYK